jgi:hypothetical protein
VRYGDTGSFCGSACQSDSDCGSGFSCQTSTLIEGGSAKQCVASPSGGKPGVCACSPRAVALGLSTPCANDYGNNTICKGNRVCSQVGAAGAGACDAAGPATETCNNSDDDCDGKTDEASCDDKNPCTTDSCDPKGSGAGADGCSHAPADNLVCDDGNPCTAGDACKASQCAAGPNVCDCQSDGDCAKQDDGDLCNGKLYCEKSVFPNKCKVDTASIVTCDGKADTACAKATCDPKSGQCAAKAVADGTLCEDGAICTVADTCKAGQCSAGTDICGCKKDSDCAAKEDGDLCNGTLYCDTSAVPYACKVDPKTPVTCSADLNTACSKAQCNPASGKCALQPVSGSCDDGDSCTVGDTCKVGACAAGLSVCECKTKGDCAAKEDGDLCNGTLDCDLATHACKIDAKTVISCSSAPNTACAKNTCDGKTGLCGLVAVTGTAACDDGNACTAGDTCKAGQCAPGASICACQKTADCAPQEDGDLCNGTLFCDVSSLPYTCKIDPKTVKTCSTASDTTCSKNTCDAKTGSCAAKAVVDGTPCSDASACTSGDACSKGSCAGSAVSCDDKNPCTNDSCPVTTGCTHVANSAPCDDGNACTTTDTCKNSQCSAGPPPSCSDGKQNGGETDQDCGGASSCGLPACPACPASKLCKGGGDCQSLVCTAGKCATASCTDKVKNGNELGVDCGGSCPLCPTLLLLAGGSSSVAGEWLPGTSWKTSTFAVPSTNEPALAPAIFAGGAVGALRFTEFNNLSDQVVHALQWTQAGWQTPKSLGASVLTRGSPSAAQVGSQTLVAFHGLDFKHYTVAWNGSMWSAAAPVGTPQSYGNSAPVLISLGNSALLVYIDGGNGNQLAGRVYNGTWANTVGANQWPDFNLTPAGAATGNSGEALVVWNKGGGQLVAQLWSGAGWQAAKDIPTALSNQRVALVAAGGKVHMAFRGQNAKLYYGSWSAGTWSSFSEVGSPGASTLTTPALAKGLSGSVELAWVDTAGAVWHSSLSGTTWSAPAQVSTGASSVSLLSLP